jgi:DNA mismatch endonuclease (patch repair protein)
LRFRLHRRDLPGHPDIVFIGRRTAVFVHGCFWHSHDWFLTKKPATREKFWNDKLAGNKTRDDLVVQKLKDSGWRVVVVWECALRGRTRLILSQVAERIEGFILGDGANLLEVRGEHSSV